MIVRSRGRGGAHPRARPKATCQPSAAAAPPLAPQGRANEVLTVWLMAMLGLGVLVTALALEVVQSMQSRRRLGN